MKEVIIELTKNKFNGKLSFTDSAMIVTVIEYDLDYLRYWMNSKLFFRQVKQNVKSC